MTMPKFIAQHVPATADLDAFTADLDAFTADYLEAIEWLLDKDIDRDAIEGWSPDALAKAKADCEAFQAANAADLEAYQDATGYSGGNDLWLTRIGHGVGYWGRGLGDVGQRLTDAARLGAYAQYAYLGDAGLLYLE